MKNFNLSLFLGCCIISIGIIISGVIIGNHLPPIISGDFSGTIIDNGVQQQEYDEFLSEYEVKRFLKIGDNELAELINSGKIDSTYTTVNNTRIFNRDALSDAVKRLMGR